MSDGRLTVLIKGREALPVRAIPYVGGWSRFPPNRTVDYLARKEKDLPRCASLTAYHQSDGNEPVSVKAREWNAVAAKLTAFEAKLREQYPNNDIGYAAWRDGAAGKFPPGVFVWLDEFELVFQADLESVSFSNEQPGVDELTLTPMISVETRSMVMEGFQSDAVTAPEEQAAPKRSPSDDDWMAQARVIADECFDHDTNANPTVRDSLARKNSAGQITGGYCFRVMGIMQERGIKGPRGIITNPGTVMREALQGEKWWANKPK